MKQKECLVDRLRWVVSAVFILCVLFAFSSTPLETSMGQVDDSLIGVQWVQLVEGRAVVIETALDAIPVQAGETMVFETTLVDLQTDTQLLFCSKNQEVRVFVDGVEIYQFLMQDAFSFLQTPGSTWHEISLVPELSGATLRVELTAQTTYYSDLFYNFHLVHISDCPVIKVQSLWVQLLAGLFLLIIAIVSYINGGIWHGTQTRSYAIHLADFYLVIAIYILGKSGIFGYFFARPLVSYMLEALALRMAPIVAYRFVISVSKRRYPIVTFVGICVWVHFFLSVALQFIWGVSFMQTRWIAHLILVLGAVLDFALCSYHVYATRREKSKRNYLFLCTVILFGSAVGEVFRFYLLPKHDELIGVFVMSGYFIYTVVSHVVLGNRNATLDRGSAAMQADYEKLRNTTLMRQIDAHFFFNTLNTISALCKEDAVKADQAVTSLAKYMRHYMYFVRTETNISFADELALVKVYLDIEKMRFDGEFSVEMDLAFVDFNLPPLSVQPLIENAVVHGLRSRNQFGQLSLSSKKEDGFAVITITDNGVGFDWDVAEKKECMAINNICTRLHDMANGTLEIQTQMGIGTTVTLRVPL
ncbi:MAG: histidine kinase [Faecalibacterium sp.]